MKKLIDGVMIVLTSNKELNPYHISYPIVWSGSVGNSDVIIIQKTHFSSFVEGYEFEKFPEKYFYLKERIIKDIDNYLSKKLD